MKDLDALFDSMEKQKQKDNFIKELKENPLQSSQFKNLIMNNDTIESEDKARMISQIGEYKKQKLVIDDIPLTWEEHKVNVKENAPDHMPIKLSMFKQLSGSDMAIATSVKLAFFDDVGGGQQSKITHYSANNGMDVSCGYGNNPSGVRIVEIDSKRTEDISIFNKAKKNYEDSMEQWQFRKKDILEGRGTKYQKWMKLDKSIIDNENQKIEKQKKAEYQAWKKANQPPRSRVYTSAELNARNSRK